MSNISNRTLSAIWLLSGIWWNAPFSTMSVLLKNYMLYFVLKLGHGMVLRKARCAKKSAKASFRLFSNDKSMSFPFLSFPSKGNLMLSNSWTSISLKISWYSVSVWITKAIGMSISTLSSGSDSSSVSKHWSYEMSYDCSLSTTFGLF